MIALDFYSGSHGHFLEYVVNAYIFDVPKVDNIFTPLGTSHLIRQDYNYMNERIVEARHYSEFKIPVKTKIDQIIRITVDNLMEKICYQINVNSRAGDIPAEKKNLSIPGIFLIKQADLRKIYYSKYSDSDIGYQIPTSNSWTLSTDKPAFEFPMSSMYNLLDFYKTLNQLADYLKQTFNPDFDLYTVWQKFIDLNHGLQSWKKCQAVFENIISKKNIDFSLETHEEALLNVLFSETFKLYDGPLHDWDCWPINTSDVYKIIEKHLADRDTI